MNIKYKNECEAFQHNLCIIIIKFCTMCIIYVIRPIFNVYFMYCILTLKNKIKTKKRINKRINKFSVKNFILFLFYFYFILLLYFISLLYFIIKYFNNKTFPFYFI